VPPRKFVTTHWKPKGATACPADGPIPLIRLPPTPFVRIPTAMDQSAKVITWHHCVEKRICGELTAGMTALDQQNVTIPEFAHAERVYRGPACHFQLRVCLGRRKMVAVNRIGSVDNVHSMDIVAWLDERQNYLLVAMREGAL
jgi:hypothetical protein